MSKQNLKGYIIQGCFGYYFSDKPSSYNCELCGTHWTMGEIDGIESLIDFSIENTFGSWLEIENRSEEEVIDSIEKEFEEEKWMLVSNFNNWMMIAFDFYNINPEHLLDLTKKYVRREYEDL